MCDSTIIVTNFRGHLISRIWKRNVSQDKTLAIVKNRHFPKELEPIKY